ncbi:ABC transporter substrate-binding protein [Scleromatobacter humisilvae]|uniref:ABC transporter substrate-binding protein n=1 Tax=Scleromatobacter humisilvae TaxID=2897159 RepID=A0A9X1YH71_9BURK|nr:ABC transporter substrate-binding protein [Scleromatobacter humisilvae]MCK9684790.1 ABC transporter substrate-binding protein [Scleromatobacter humisilvae]
MTLLRGLKALAPKAARSLALALAVALPGAHAAALRIASAFDPQTMDPHSLALQYHTRVAFQIYESLVGRDQNYRLVPVLATSWTQTDPLTWRFKLRPDVRFHDGSPFTAEDAVFSFQRALAPPSQRQFVLKGVKRVRMVDPLTIDFELAAPDASLPQKLVLVAMMSKRWSQAHHVERAQDYNARQETFAVRNANGTGAYQLERYEPDIRTTLKAFPQWWNRRSPDNGNVDSLSFVTIRSDATRLAALQSGEVDLVLDPPYQDVEQLRHDPAIAVTQVGDIATDYLAFDQASAALPGVAPGPDGKPRNPFKDLRVRRAVYQAINIDLVIQKVLKGLATPTGDLLSPEFDAPVAVNGPRLRFDPVHARELLRDAGYADGFDLTMDCVNVAFREHVCQAIAAMLTQVGIRTTLRTSPSTQFFPMITQGKVSLAEFGFTGTSEDAWQSLNGLLHTWDSNGGGTFNAGRYSNPRLDALIDAVRTEGNPDKRRVLVATALKLAGDDVVYVPLYRRTLSWVMQKKVHVVMLPDDTIPVRWASVR